DEEGIVPHFKAEVQESSTAETPKQDTQVDETEATDTSVEVCKIVDDLFKDGDPKDIFKDACNLKYSGNNSRLGWKCIPTSGVSTTTSGSGGEKATGGDTTGSICVPPRRRRLYIHDLQSLIGKDGTTPTQEDLLKWFVKSAAVETFFLWHRYKKENTKKTQAPQLPLLGVDTVDGDPDDPQSPQSPQSKLQKSGNIPPDFLRLMFYTLGDYRDILFSGIKDEKNGYNDILRGDNVIQEREENINTAIESVFKPSGSSPPAPDKKNTPKDWWDQNGQHIWNAMVCALTYDTNTTSGKTTITQDGTLKEKLLDNNNKPKTNAGPKSNIDYTYEKVELKEDEGGPKTNEAPTSQTTQSQASGENPPKLSDFVLRPTYFRYLEEWGETFCRQRARMLGKIKYECRSHRGGHEYCSGDGHDCTENGELRHHKMLEDPNCPSCYEQCRKYRKWIDLKFEEYQNQQSIYQKEHGKLTARNCSGGDGGDNTNFCQQIKEKTTVQQFLESLKHCKDNQGNSDPNNKLDFDNPLQTFSPSTYCKTCPFNIVNCNGGGRRSGRNGCNVNGNENTWKEVFDANGGNSTTIDVQMIDRRGPFIKNYSKDLENSQKSQNSNHLFKTSRLFKAIREQKWTCKFKDKNTDVCKLTNFNDKIDLNPYTTFKVLLVYWLEDFLYGYYILKKRKIIEKCTQKGENTCSDEQSKKNCACVKTWVDQKKNEWDQIKKHFKNREQEYGQRYDIKYTVKTFLGILIYRMDLKNGKQRISNLDAFLKAYACKCADNSEKKGDAKDTVECLLQKLGEKAEKCKTQASGETCTDTAQPQTPDDDEDLLLDETEENPVEQPNICPQEEKKEQKDEEEKCDEKEEEEEKEEEKDKGDGSIEVAQAEPEPEPEPQEEPPAPVPSTPSPPKPTTPQNLFDNPHLIPSLVTSTLAWSVGIGFAAFTYFFLK
ncbi:hypothetical protein PFBG_06070, partial [Plasmodium falciparum 7G8]